MLQKFLKIVFILFIISSFCITYVYATDINLNLPGTDTNSTDNINSDTNQEIPDTTNEQLESPTGNENIEDSPTTNNEEVLDDETVDDPSIMDSTQTETLQPSDVSTAPETGLGITNIINILLITVGVIIILLAIAIMIRLKN